MLTNIAITLALLLLSTLILSRIFTLSKNIWLLFLAQPLAMSSSPVIVFIGAILSANMVEDPSLATLPVTLMILGVATASIPAAIIAKRKGRRFATLTGFSCALLASCLATISAISSHFELFALSALLFGVNAAFVQQMRFAAIESTKQPENVPRVLSILMLSGIFSAFLGPEIAVASKDLIDSPHGYAGSFMSLSTLLLAAMALMMKFENPDIQSDSQTGPSRPLSAIIRQPIFVIAILSAAIGFALMSYLMTATPLSMHQMHGYSLQDTKWVIQSHIAAMFIPSLFTAWLVNRLGLKALLFTGTLIYAGVALIALSGQEVMHYWWALMLLGIGWNFLFLTGTSLLPQGYRASERHKVQAINDVILFGSQATASLMAGWVLFKAGWHILVLSSLPFVGILLLASFYYFRMEKQALNAKNDSKLESDLVASDKNI